LGDLLNKRHGEEERVLGDEPLGSQLLLAKLH